jgi:hypothetical protein
MSSLGGGKYGCSVATSGGCVAELGGGHQGGAVSLFYTGGQLLCWGWVAWVWSWGPLALALHGVGLAGVGCPCLEEVTQHVWGHCGSWAMCGVLGQVVAAVVGCSLWCVVGCGASCGVLAIGVWVRVAVIVVG